MKKRFLLMPIVAICVVTAVFGNFVAGKTVVKAIHLTDNESVYDAHIIEYINTAETPLINAEGVIDQTVFKNLITKLNEAKKREVTTTDGTYTESHAGDFSDTIIASDNRAMQSGAILVKLFPTMGTIKNTEDTNGTTFTKDERRANLSDGWFQAVYRTTGDDKDTLTLYSASPYRCSYFNSNSNIQASKTKVDDQGNKHKATENGRNWIYTYEGNYSTSIVRNNLLTDWEYLLQGFGANGTIVNELFVAPSDLPGKWQSSDSQTGTNANEFYFQPGTTNDSANTDKMLGLGASGYGRDNTFSTSFTLNNGLDGNAGGAVGFVAENGGTGWTNSTTILPAYSDKMFIPSAYETFYMGKDKEKHSVFASRVNSYGVANSKLISSPYEQTPEVRHGLWQLNGYDRCHDNTRTGLTLREWLRSGRSDFNQSACQIERTGMPGSTTTENFHGLRPALHLNLLAIQLDEEVSSSITASFDTNSAQDATVDPSEATITKDDTVQLTLNAGDNQTVAQIQITPETGIIEILDESLIGTAEMPTDGNIMNDTEVVAKYKVWYVDETKQQAILELSEVIINLEILASGKVVETTPTEPEEPVNIDINMNLDLGENYAGLILSYTEGEELILPTANEMSKEGHTFESWYIDEQRTIPITQINSTNISSVLHNDTIEIYPNWTKTSGDITWMLNGGTWATGYQPPTFYNWNIGIAIEDFPAEANLEQREGLMFAGWYTTETGGTQVTSISTDSTENMTFWAKWEEDSTSEDNEDSTPENNIDPFKIILGACIAALLLAMIATLLFVNKNKKKNDTK